MDNPEWATDPNCEPNYCPRTREPGLGETSNLAWLTSGCSLRYPRNVLWRQTPL